MYISPELPRIYSDQDTFRRGTPSRPLAPEETEAVAVIKLAAEELNTYVKIARRDGADPRCMSIAQTKLEEAVFWAVKGITT